MTKELEAIPASAQQEPVAYRVDYPASAGVGLPRFFGADDVERMKRKAEPLAGTVVPLYTRPQASAQPSGAEVPEGWVSVADRLPTAENDYLVKGIKHSGLYYDIAGLFRGKWMSQVTQEDCKFEVSHWMPLPTDSTARNPFPGEQNHFDIDAIARNARGEFDEAGGIYFHRKFWGVFCGDLRNAIRCEREG